MKLEVCLSAEVRFSDQHNINVMILNKQIQLQRLVGQPIGVPHADFKFN